jgi:uncharacterized membrane protein YphA (DoxX/SURF4 family)
MNSTLERLQVLSDRREIAYALIRIYLGLALFIRGWMILADPSAITRLTGAQELYMWYSYVIAGHLIGGAFLTFGWFTRIAALIQIPILVGAVFLVHIKQGLMSVGQSLELASLVLILLLVFAVFGSGQWSVDHVFATKRPDTYK